MESDERDGPPRALLIAAVVVGVGAIVAILAFAALRETPAEEQVVGIVSVPAPEAESADCGALTAALPDKLGDFDRARVAEPAPPGAAAWRTEPDSEAVILRCGLARPAEFVVGTPLQVVDAVSWFHLSEQGRSTWYAVDRPVYVALTLPQDSGPTPIQDISEAIAKSLPATPIDPAPVS
ncbi:DUF3515 domain-containing protein [Mycolicibacterium holsaticum]|uniref:DUF3515 domain-containing protein n=1 Tax=Mycolicibacterium holsaticum TaxID=152142 RepID=UPI001C7E101E|nr:DUF3515 domain-containing protein [Mycolicibacterium holsaticum]MDA4110448.1 membrane protein [Mycolicibacterium holsaticum DSM 44478 = JCM 12374]QZA10979.1 DUF3515 domain-containing protein [Mycolicibacterium holsaticum DSM 44478 = JCM 12374]UNC11526.1 DUF3515 domain-containing protein [Mycolicibacterium holsaticum DSM 44478 = JCM 12374]